MAEQKKRKSKPKGEAAAKAAAETPVEPAAETSPATISFTGNRYLLDANNSRQYAIRFEDNVPQLPVEVFARASRDSAEIKAGETVFAIADDVEFTKESGKLRALATAYQIVQGDNGKPKRLLEAQVEFEVELGRSSTGDKMIFYTLTPEAKFKLQLEEFSDEFPQQFQQALDPELAADLSPTYLPKSMLRLPPQHDDGLATIARIATDFQHGPPKPPEPVVDQRKEEPAPQPIVKTIPPVPVPDRSALGAVTPATAYGYAKVDAQTLVEKKNLGDGDTLKLVFNFEARRVTESVTSKAGVALASHKFADYDEAALGAAFNALQQLGGSPRPLEDAPKPAKLAQPKTPGK